MTRVYLGIGSNTGREYHLLRGLDALSELCGELQLSPLFESDAVGVLGKRFYNMVVGVETHLNLADLNAALKAIEAACGRRESPLPGRITLDIDVLCYGDLSGVHDGIVLPRPEVARNAFVLWPLALLAPQQRLPGAGQTFEQLWANWQGSQSLWPVAFSWRDRELTPAHLLADHQPREAL
ncbi:MAG: 2-amino-4-hydroxy-6-hydroxymethyldihydropteridine diphosphokinase [Pseudomonadales bacterium]|nr:2-amino-4-hydroxy-6-hydroxymethyldihydropteridine diphosphokinase [Pseudomonadales bacterium]